MNELELLEEIVGYLARIRILMFIGLGSLGALIGIAFGKE